MSKLLKHLSTLRSALPRIRKSFGEDVPNQVRYLLDLCDDIASEIDQVEQLNRVAKAAWKERNVYLMQCENAVMFLESRGWKPTDQGRWLSPYNGDAEHPHRAMKSERESARRELAKELVKVGYPVYKSKKRFPLKVAHAVAQCDPDTAILACPSSTPA